MSMSEIVLQPYAPGVLGEVVHHHGVYYADHWNFDARFETQVAHELAEFIRDFDDGRDGFWWAACDGAFAGSVAVDGSRSGEGEARLRWFIVPESFQGKGIGACLFDAAMVFCREREFQSVCLWTFAGLDAAHAVYERNGFQLVDEVVSDGWGPVLTEQKYVLPLTRLP